MMIGEVEKKKSKVSNNKYFFFFHFFFPHDFQGVGGEGSCYKHYHQPFIIIHGGERGISSYIYIKKSHNFSFSRHVS